MKPILITLALWLWAVAATAQVAPTGFGATPTAYNQIDLKWTHNGANVDEFVIERSDGNNRTYKALATVLQSAKANREYSDKTVSASLVYYYRITTKLGTKLSATVETNATTPANPTPATPNGLDITGKTISSLSVKWNPVAGAEGYETRLSTKSDFTTDLKPGATTKSDFTFSGLAPDRTYFVQVRARNTVGVTDYWSPWSGSVSGRTDQAPPAAPSGVQATPKSPTQVAITWTDNDDFIISRSAAGSGGPWTEAGRVNANVKTFTDNGVQTNTTYYYQVCAANKAGQA